MAGNNSGAPLIPMIHSGWFAFPKSRSNRTDYVRYSDYQAAEKNDETPPDKNFSDNLTIAELVEKRQRLAAEIQRDQQELAEIDRMISRINESEFQSKRE